MLMITVISILALALCSVSALEVSGNTVTIHNASDFIELSDNVNERQILYEGSTVLLAADIDFTGYSDKFNPIGTGFDPQFLFLGEFDGQGHTISNLNMNSSSRYVAPFGVINGTAFRNLVVDSSCSFLNTHNEHYIAYTSGVIGFIYPLAKTWAVVEGCVNMASVTFTGNRTEEGDSTIAIGGVLAYVMPNFTDFRMRDCVNYGTITYSGSYMTTSIGGVFGAFLAPDIFSKYDCIMENCANYGRLVHDGETDSMLSFGGIVGVSVRGRIENCINYATYKTNQDATAAGKITGAGVSRLTITNCFWTDEADTNVSWGFEYMSTPVATNTHLVESNVTTMDILNEWVSTKSGGEYNHSKWMMLHLNGGRIGTVNEDDLLIVPQKPFPEPAKEGHTFSCWCTDPECALGEYNGTLEDATDLYAEWEIGVYTVTFDYGNGTLIYSSFTFNTTIVYPDMSGVKGFRGWNSSIERMPGHNLVIGPDTTPPPSKSHAGAIAGGVIGGVALIAIIVLIVLFFLLRSTHKKKETVSMRALERNKGVNKRWLEERGGGALERRAGGGGRLEREAALRRGGPLERGGELERRGDGIAFRGRGPDVAVSAEIDGDSVPITSTAFTDTLYPEPYSIPTMMEALKEAGIGENGAKLIVEFCEDVGRGAVKGENVPEGFTEADAAAVAMYTFDFDPEENEASPYELINDSLMYDDSPESVRGVLYLVMSALRKLPRYKDRLLYRSVRGPIDANTYKKGSVVMWPAIVSTSPDMGAIKKLISEANEVEGEENAGNVKGTLFVIENGWGYNIQPYSLFPDDGEEILLEPERRFQVDSVIVSDVTIVNLKMLDTPLVLPQVFGDNTK